jgi:hypothetical protein
VALLTVAALVYLCLIRPHGGLALWHAAADANPDALRQQESDPESYGQDVARRSGGRHRVVDDVIAGRLTLAAAAARFQELDEASATFNWDRFRAVAPGSSDGEKQCHAVIRHVENLLSNDPDRQRAVTGRLWAELRALEREAASAAPAGGATDGVLTGLLPPEPRR